MLRYSEIQSAINPGDLVYVENYKKSSKSDPHYLPTPFKVVDMDIMDKKLTLRIQGGNNTLFRHPDKVKPFYDTQHQDKPVELGHEQPLQNDHTAPTMHDAAGDEYSDDDAVFDSNGNDLELCNDGTSSQPQQDASALTQQTN